MRRFIKSFGVFFVLLVLFSLVAGKPAKAWQLSRQLDPGEYLLNNVRAGMIVYNVDPNALFNLMTDNTKDYLFYPGVGAAYLVSGDGGKGSIYTEETPFGPSTIYVLKKDAPKEYVIYGKSAFIEYIATYKFNPRPDNSVEYTSYNTIITSVPGITADFFKAYLDSGDQKILDYMGLTGEILADVPPMSDSDTDTLSVYPVLPTPFPTP